MSLNRCPRKDTPHPPHPIRLYFSPGVVHTTCPGEPALDDMPSTEWESDGASKGAGE